MDFTHTTKVIEAKEQLEAFMDEHVYPREREHHDFVMDGDNLWKQPPVVEELKVKAKEAGIDRMAIVGQADIALPFWALALRIAPKWQTPSTALRLRRALTCFQQVYGAGIAPVF